jgi:YVTN family beta-propeller protein
MRALAAVALVLLAACTSAGQKSTGPSSRPPTAPPTSAVPSRLGYLAVPSPVGLAALNGRVWAVSVQDGTVVAIDPTTAKVTRRVRVGPTPVRAVAYDDLLWVSVFGAGRLVAVDPATGKIVRRVALPGQPEGLAAGFGSIWVVRQQAGKLTRVSAAGRVGPSYPLGDEPRLVTATDRYLVVSNFGGGTLTRVDPRSGNTATSAKLCAGPQGLASSGTTVWVTCTTQGVLLAVDERTLHVTGRLTIRHEPDAVRIYGDRLYVVATLGPTLYEIRADPMHPTLLNSHKLGKAFALHDQANVDFVLDGGRALVSSFGEGRVYVLPR